MIQLLFVCALQHLFSPIDRVKSTNQYCMWDLRRISDYVKQMVDAVTEIHISVTSFTIHDLVAIRSSSAPGMRGLINYTCISLTLYNSTRSNDSLPVCDNDLTQ